MKVITIIVPFSAGADRYGDPPSSPVHGQAPPPDGYGRPNG
jgi:hypothetical protein